MKTKRIYKLNEYEEFPYKIPNIYIYMNILKDIVEVSTIYIIEKKIEEDIPFILKGKDIILKKIEVNDKELKANNYKLNNNQIIISSPTKSAFKLKIDSTINPFKNISLEGLYSSNNIITSQCEAEGFRRICFHPDRPDILSKYQVSIEADKEKYPILLANGNLIAKGEISENKSRHIATWDDPFPKPSYLFAIVAGKLSRTSTTYISKTRKEVNINIWTEDVDKKYTHHALKSLKKAMKWDEDIYDFEYDLDIYNIVAIRHFNMGAMENKGLNIFNSKLILADSKIATDSELMRIESVIAHEYFHNWTGNRITCRDWFQLSLKEGLTVFRDQSFTSDLHSFSSKRIEDVSFLRNHQFKEDAGPTSHAVKPKEYVSIDNFYTTTIYEKGAEIIRMIYTLLGKDHYFNGITNYVKKFDGKAATTEDFLESMIEGASNNGYILDFDILDFKNWYYIAGTPLICIKRFWDEENGNLRLLISQKIKSSDLDKNKIFIVPIKVRIFHEKNNYKEELIVLKEKEQFFEFSNLKKTKNNPIVSCFRSFSAPVNWDIDLKLDELIFLIENETDSFSQWNCIQLLYKKAILNRAYNKPDNYIESSIVRTLKNIINNIRYENINLLADILTLPELTELELLNSPINPIRLYDSYYFLTALIAKELYYQLKELLEKIKKNIYLVWPDGQSERKLIALIWHFLLIAGDSDLKHELLFFINSNSMTLSLAALNSLKHVDCKERSIAMNIFYDRWKEKPIILDSWFLLEASIDRQNALEITKKLLQHSKFDPTSPNSIRSVLGGFIRNTKSFHSSDGSGYIFIAEQIIQIDSRNPITASRIVKIFSNWANYIEPNSKNMFIAIETINNQSLSSNTKEVIDNIMKKNHSQIT